MILKGGKILDGENNFIYQDIRIENDLIVEIADEITGSEIFDVKDLLITPGFIDVHVHTRNPGQEYKESVETISNSALAGGYSTILAMPNTSPVIDTPQKVEDAYKLYENSSVQIFQYGALSKNLVECQPADFQQMYRKGAIAFSNDGRGVQNEELILELMKELLTIDGIYVSHSEVDSLVGSGVMHAGRKNKKLKLPGISSSVEAVAVAKEVVIATELNARLHLCHLSSKYSVELLRLFKKYNSKLSGEVTPHHLLLSEDDILEDDSNFKMNPPLRSEQDRQELIKGLNDGTIEVIATDHAPHTADDKGSSFIGGAFGIVGLETSFDLLYTNLVLTNLVSLQRLIDCMTVNPARIFKLDTPQIKVGEIANLTVVNLCAPHQINVDSFAGRCKNSPFDQQNVNSSIKMTIIKGEIRYAKN